MHELNNTQQKSKGDKKRTHLKVGSSNNNKNGW